MELSYDIGQSYEFNYEHGPFFSTTPPNLPPGPAKTFLGLPVRSRIGISAGLLLNSKWVLGYAQRGFDILTYKTVRSCGRASYPPPNLVFVEPRAGEEAFYLTEKPSRNPAELSSAICFGMPSMSPEVWREDIKRAKAGLANGQILIVSVVATPREDCTLDFLARDYCRCAVWARESGADVIEANLSCPNVCSSEGSLYHDAAASGMIALALRAHLGRTPLLLKIGHVPQGQKLKELLSAVAGHADGITLVNCLVRPVLRANGEPVFGKAFQRAGVAGRLIHEPALASARRAAEIIAAEGLGLAVVANGGASTQNDINDFFAAGASAVVLGSSPMYLPNLAAEMKRLHPEW